ncbi:hypothetical protein OG894_22470 [Streptomyces sp. NBC_01724]|uniref:hypothetical protein n=1 Tax=unclassified Streptomyces TaxID=2593676 RepID=UPI0028C48F59|nr:MULTISPECIES: hypothetical protein [unclassified Streptomyces]WNO65845.1 hypothetical protein RPQ02_19615 [Streptomyces sp. AM2-3-1]WTE60872.1 hypothetical protein OG784_19915 [Streptomyces sp. NBC_01617]
MRIRRILAAVIATAALTGLGLTGAATATAATATTATATSPAESPTPGECEKGGGMVDRATNTCKGGTFDGQMVD